MSSDETTVVDDDECPPVVSSSPQLLMTASHDRIVFPDGTFKVEVHLNEDNNLNDTLVTEEEANETEFDIKVESIKVDNPENQNFDIPTNVLHDDNSHLNFNASDVSQLHFLPLSSDDIENLQKINHNVLMSQAALPEDNKPTENMIEQGECKTVFIRQSSNSDVNKLDNFVRTEEQTTLFVKNERSSHESDDKNQGSAILNDQNSYSQIVYIQLDDNGEATIISPPPSSSEQSAPTSEKEKQRKVSKDEKPSPVKVQNIAPVRNIAPRLSQFPLYAGAQAGMGGKALLKPISLGSLQAYEGGEYFEVLGRCIQCIRFSRTTSYCRAEKNHRDAKSSVCNDCEMTGLSTVVCRRKLNHTAPNALPLNIVINTALQQPEQVKQLCFQNNLPACFADLQSIVMHHADIPFTTVRSNDDQNVTIVARKPSDFARGYLYPYTTERWDQWLCKFCLQSNTSYRIRTGKRVNKKLDHGLANHNGKIVQYRTLETQLLNCSLGGKPRKRKIREGAKRRKERGSKMIGCSAVIHTRLIETEHGWRALEVTVPKITSHLSTHDPRIIQKMNVIVDNASMMNQLYVEEDLEKKRTELKKNSKNILLMCSTLLDQTDDLEALSLVQEHGQIILNKLIKDISIRQNTPIAPVPQPPAKKKTRKNDIDPVEKLLLTSDVQ